MKRALFALSFVLALVSAPLASFAQSTQSAAAGLTRAQVKAELVQLEAVGYRPSADAYDYPNDIQAAEARVHANQAPSATIAAQSAPSPQTAVGAD